MRFTIDVSQDLLAGVWAARCIELDVISQHTLPERAIEAAAEAVRMTLGHEMRRHDISCVQAYESIKADAAAPAAKDEPNFAGSLHQFVQIDSKAFVDGLEELQQLRSVVSRAIDVLHEAIASDPTTFLVARLTDRKTIDRAQLEELAGMAASDLKQLRDSRDRLRDEVHDLCARNLELAHSAGQVEGMQEGAEVAKREIVRLESLVSGLRERLDREHKESQRLRRFVFESAGCFTSEQIDRFLEVTA